MNDDMPWVDLTPEEIQQLRTNKQQLTEYGKEKIKQLMMNQEPYPDEMFEEAERREAANKALDKLHEENGDALQQLAAIERKELIEELEAKKKENFQLVADACMKEYEQKYQRDVFPVDEHWVYMVGEYFGTGEGQTTCIMMTQANAGHAEDFQTSTNKYVPCTTKEYRAVREFHEQFGTWMLHGLKFLTREDFFGDYAFYIPPMMMKLNNQACYKTFYTYVHYNFS